MRNILFVFWMTITPMIFADIFNELDKELELINSYCAGTEGEVQEESIKIKGIFAIQKVVYCRNGNKHIVDKKEYHCTFPKSFFVARCGGQNFLYNEELSSIKSNTLKKIYTWSLINDPNRLEDTCHKIKSNTKNHNDTKKLLLKCPDLGIVLISTESY